MIDAKIGLLCLLWFALPAVAEAEYVPADLMFLYESGDYAAALHYARRFKNTQSHTNFHYYYGLAAIKAGQLPEGIAALEKVVHIEPNNYVVQLALAKAYDLQGRPEQSRLLLVAMSTRDLPADVLAEIHGLLHRGAIEQQVARPIFFAQTGVGFDDNPGNAQLLGRRGVNRVFIDRTQSVQRRDGFWASYGGVGWYQPVLAQSALRFILEAETRLYRSNDEFNFNDYTLQVQFEKNSRHYDFEAGLVLQNLSVDSVEFQSSQAVEIAWYPRLSDSLALIVEGQFVDQKFDQQRLLDSELFYYDLGLQGDFAIAGRPSWRFSYLSGYEDPDQRALLTQVLVARDISALELQLNIELSQHVEMGLLLTEQSSDFKGADSRMVRLNREETYFAAQLEITYRINSNLKTMFYWHSVENDDVNRFELQGLMSLNISRRFSQSLLGVDLRYDWGTHE